MQFDCPETESATDADLLSRFVCHQDDLAFTELVRRHGPMVLGVCTQILRQHQDAQDAFQATFLILAMRAHSIKQENSLGSWLYQVAYRTAMRSAKQRQQSLAQLVVDDTYVSDDPLQTIYEQSLQTALHEELTKLPAAYRAPLVLCYMEGKTRNEAASELECTAASIKARLARAKRMMRVRLSRRGIALSVAMTAACKGIESASADVSCDLAAAAVQNAATTIASGSTDHLTPDIVYLITKGNALMSVSTSAKMVACAAAFGFAVFGWTLLAGDGSNREPARTAQVSEKQFAAAEQIHSGGEAIPVQLVADEAGQDGAYRDAALGGETHVNLDRVLVNTLFGPIDAFAKSQEESERLKSDHEYAKKKAEAYFLLRDAQLEKARVATDQASRMEAKAIAQLHEAEAEKLTRDAERLQQALTSLGPRVTTFSFGEPIPPTPCCRENNLAHGKSVRASSEEEIVNNLAPMAVDGDLSTRWCAEDDQAGQWVEVDLGHVQSIQEIRIHWEMMGTKYSYRVETSVDGKDWAEIVDTSGDPQEGHMPEHSFDAVEARFVRVTFLGSDQEYWASIREIEVAEDKLADPPTEAWEKIEPDAVWFDFPFYLGTQR